MIGVLAGYCPIGIHTNRRLKILEDKTCQSFIEEDDVETSRLDFLLHCPASATLMLKHIDCRTFYEPDELAEIDISRLNNYRAGSKRFVSKRRSFWSITRSSGHHNW